MRVAWAVALLVACDGGDDTDGGACGEGAPDVAIGRTVDGAFVPYADGDEIPVGTDGNGLPRFVVEHRIAGVDVGDDVTAVLRVTFDGDPSDDFLAQVRLDCEDDGRASFTGVAPFPSRYAEPDFVPGLDGTGVRIDSVFTDAGGTTADGGVDLVIDASTYEPPADDTDTDA